MCSIKYHPRAMRDDWITDKNTNKIGEKIPHNSKREHVLLRYKRDSVGSSTKTSWWGKAGHKLTLSTLKSCSDIQNNLKVSENVFRTLFSKKNCRRLTVNLLFPKSALSQIISNSVFWISEHDMGALNASLSPAFLHQLVFLGGPTESRLYSRSMCSGFELCRIFSPIWFNLCS